MTVECMRETLTHIRRVQSLMREVVDNLIGRAIVHDESKLGDVELPVFAEASHKLKDVEYGSDEYRQCLDEMQPAQTHHYNHNRHHPEYWARVSDMTLCDLIEMLVDWKAASERHANGNIQDSITINKKQFGFGGELEMILRHTAADELFPESR